MTYLNLTVTDNENLYGINISLYILMRQFMTREEPMQKFLPLSILLVVLIFLGDAVRDIHSMYRGNQYKTQASSHLKDLRSGTYLFIASINLLNKTLETADLAYEDIGTSKAEIEQLKRDGHRRLARRHLDRAIDNPLWRTQSLNLMELQLYLGMLSYDDIGTDIDTVQKLRMLSGPYRSA